MLSAIKDALTEATKSVGAVGNRSAYKTQWFKIEHYLKSNQYITNSDVRQMFDVSASTANRILSRLLQEGKLCKLRIGKS